MPPAPYWSGWWRDLRRTPWGTPPRAAWYSDDDVTWHRSEIRLEKASTTAAYDLTLVFPSGPVLYAIGTGGVPLPDESTALTSIEFRSTDGGASWTQLPSGNAPRAVLRDVVAGGPGFVAVGDRGTLAAQPEIFTSTDGVTWRGLGDPPSGAVPGIDVPGVLTAVAEHDGTLMAVGARRDMVGGVILTSRDGLTWRSLPAPEGMVPSDLTWTSGSWVVVGYVPKSADAAASTPMAWQSTDGKAWTQVPMDARGATNASSVSGSGWGIVAAGDWGQHAVAWTSGGGGAWVAHALDGGSFNETAASLALVTRRGLLVTGSGNAAFGRLPVAWFSPTSADATPPPEPAAETGTPAPTATPPPPSSSIPESPIFSSWRHVDLPDPAPDEYGGVSTSGLVRFGDRWIAVGFVNGGCCDGSYSDATRGVIWTSADGEEWDLVPPQVSLAHSRISSVATNGKALVAVGVVEMPANDPAQGPVRQPASWYSTDGTTWHLVGNAPDLALVTVAGGRFVAASEANQMVTFYTSADGHAWSQTSGAGPGDASADTVVRVLGLAGRPDGWVVAVGFVSEQSSAGEMTDSATIWSTFDPEAGIEMTSPADGAWMNDVVALDNGWMAVGSAIDGTQALTWTLAGDASPLRPVSMEEVASGNLAMAHVLAAGSDIVVVGSGPGAGSGTGDATIIPRIWVRVAGAWYRVNDPALLSARPDLAVLAWDTAGQRILALGTGWNGHAAAVLWMSDR